MKKRYVVALCVLIFSALLVLPVLALDLHALLSREQALISFSPLIGWNAVIQIQQVCKMYFLLLIALAMGLFSILVTSSSLQYRSNMQKITPDIQTPCAAGQGQYGTARWMPKSEFHLHFPTIQIKELENIDELLRAGRQDKEEINAKEKRHSIRRSGAGLDE